MTAKELALTLGYQLKIVTSVGLFDNYDMFHNIFEQYEEPCRRIVLLTKDENLTEVYEVKNKTFPFENLGNIWLSEFPINISYSDIKLDEMVLNEKEIETIKALVKIN